MNFPRRHNIVLSILAALCIIFSYSCGNSGGDKGDGDQASLQPPAWDLTGTWEVKITEYNDHGTNVYTKLLEIFQNGIDVTIANFYDGKEYTGTLSGNRLTFSGGQLNEQGQFRINGTATVSDDGNFFVGTADWNDTSETQGGERYEEFEATKISNRDRSAAGLWEGHILQETSGDNSFTVDINQEDGILSGKLSISSMGMENVDLTGSIDEFGIEFGDVNGSILFTGTIHFPSNQPAGHSQASASGVLQCNSLGSGVEWSATKKIVRPEGNFQWELLDMGTTSELQKKIVIGSGRNDAVRRVYSADSHGGNIHEFTFTNGRWQEILFGEYTADSGDSSTLHGIRDMTVGDGRDDGIHRIYAASNTIAEYEGLGQLFQGLQIDYSQEGQGHNGRHWNGADGIAIAALRNDGRQRVYLAVPVGVIELTANAGAWSREDIFIVEETSDDEENKVQKIVVADGRNDGRLRLYTLENHHDIYEYTWDNGQWARTECMSVEEEIYDMCSGNGRNDGVCRFYIARGDHGIYEMSRSGALWTVDQITTANPVEIIEIGPGRNNDRQYLYGGNGNGLSEYLYSGNWQLTSLLAGGLEISDITVGDGRNSGVTGVYVTAGNSHLYEFMVENGSFNSDDL